MNEQVIANPIWLNKHSGLEISARCVSEIDDNSGFDVYIQILSDEMGADPSEERIKSQSFHLPGPTNNGHATSYFVPVKSGNLLSLSIATSSVLSQASTYYVVLNVRQYPNANAPILASILRGFVSRGMPLIYPGATYERSTEGEGSLFYMDIGDPAPGTGYGGFSPGAGELWRIDGISFGFTTSAAVANRFPYVQIIDNGGFVVFQSVASILGITASTTAQITFTNVGTIVNGGPATATTIVAPMPPITITPNCLVTVTALNIQAADQFTNLAIGHRSWPIEW